MVDPVSATSLALQSFNTARQILKSFSELKTDAQTQSQVIDLQNAILGAQDAAMQMQQALAEERELTERLKAELKAHAEWSTTLKMYKLVDAGLGTRLFVRQDSDNPYFICPNCVTDRIESILQPTGFEGVLQWCPKCDRKFQTKEPQPIRY